MTTRIIKEQFIRSASHFTSDISLVTSLWREIEKRYNSRGRYYHTLEHIDHVADTLLPFKERFTNWDTVVFAVAYHDIVYNPIRSDNEESSSQFAAKALQMIGAEDRQIQRCQEFIIATKAHEPSDIETNLFTDADLSILGGDPSLYDLYSENVRKEYGIFPALVYNPGRKKVLKHFLSMEFIFKTPEFRELLENQARGNLQRELQSYLKK